MFADNNERPGAESQSTPCKDFTKRVEAHACNQIQHQVPQRLLTRLQLCQMGTLLQSGGVQLGRYSACAQSRANVYKM